MEFSTLSHVPAPSLGPLEGRLRGSYTQLLPRCLHVPLWLPDDSDAHAYAAPDVANLSSGGGSVTPRHTRKLRFEEVEGLDPRQPEGQPGQNPGLLPPSLTLDQQEKKRGLWV